MNKAELKYIFYCATFAALYFFLALPWLIKTINGNILVQFLIFTVGVILILNIYFKSRSTGMRINFLKSVEYMLVVLAIAIFIPPYSVVPWSGEIQNKALLQTSSVDYVIGTIGSQYLHLKGILVSIWTFLIVPILLLFIASRISRSSFVKQI